MKALSSLIALSLVATIGAAAAPASAEGFLQRKIENSVVQIRIGNNHDRDRLRWLEPRKVRQILRREGFQDIGRPNFQPRRNTYLVFAENRRGRDVRVTVNASNGRILSVDPVKPRGRGHKG